ncbi:hypothetical protein DFH28DRAFT_1223144 [Melampsora americana]|nr:hypothetical protein DFH28DRAFT_1223144 [Melampsora americana]
MTGRYHSKPKNIHTFIYLEKRWYILLLSHKHMLSNALPVSSVENGRASKSAKDSTGFVNEGYISEGDSRLFPLIPPELMVTIVFGIIAFLCVAAILILLTDRNKHKATSSVEGDHKVEYHENAQLRKQSPSAPTGTVIDPTSSETTTSSIRKKRPTWVPGSSFFKETGLAQETSGSTDQRASHQEEDKVPAEKSETSLTKPDVVDAVPGAESQTHPAHKIIPILRFLKRENVVPVAHHEIDNIEAEDKEKTVAEVLVISPKGESSLQSSKVADQGQRLEGKSDPMKETAEVTPKEKKKSREKLSKGKKPAKSRKSDESRTDNTKIVAEFSRKSLKVDPDNKAQGGSTDQNETKAGQDVFVAEAEVLVTESTKDPVPKDSVKTKPQEHNEKLNQPESNTIKADMQEESHLQQEHNNQKLTKPYQKTRHLRRVFEQDTIDKGEKKFLARIESTSLDGNPELKLQKNLRKETSEENSVVKSEKNSRQATADEKPGIKIGTSPGKEIVEENSAMIVENKSHQGIVHDSEIVRDTAPSEKAILDQNINTVEKTQDTRIELTTAEEESYNKGENIQPKKGKKDDKQDQENLSKNFNQKGLYEFPSIASKESGPNSPERIQDNTNDVQIVTQLGEAQ